MQVEVEVRLGDFEDPLAGVIRFRFGNERPVDLIVGRHPWQTSLLERSELLDIGELRVAVPRSADLQESHPSAIQADRRRPRWRRMASSRAAPPAVTPCALAYWALVGRLP